MDKKKLDEQFDEIEKSLAGVQDSTAAVAKSVEDQTAHVKESLENMTGVLDGMKTNDDKREQELAGLKTDIENIKSMIPKVTIAQLWFPSPFSLHFAIFFLLLTNLSIYHYSPS